MKNADKVISINEGLRECTIQMGKRGRKKRVTRADVELESFNPADRDAIRRKHGINEEDAVLFFMGWLYSFSGLKEVAMELAGASEKHRSIKLLTLGKGDPWDTLQDIKRESGLDSRIITVGWQPYKEMPKYIVASDISLLPAYKNEVMKNIVPIKMYEYMAAGKPVIATSLPGIMKEFGNDNRVIYVDRPEDVVKKAVELVESGSIEEEGRKAGKFVEKYSWDNITDEFEGILEEVV
ncbi:glycosyltransferase [Methanophagales archaeon]|nr:MAG: glycosyltransferase [Methanophagales archaeon]